MYNSSPHKTCLNRLLAIIAIALATSSCVDDHAVAITNDTEDILYDVTYSDCYWGTLEAGDTTPTCIPGTRSDHVRFYRIEAAAESPARPPGMGMGMGMPADMGAMMMDMGANDGADMGATPAPDMGAMGSMMGDMAGGGMMGGGMMGGGMMPPGMRRPRGPVRYRTIATFEIDASEVKVISVTDDGNEADPDVSTGPGAL